MNNLFSSFWIVFILFLAIIFASAVISAAKGGKNSSAGRKNAYRHRTISSDGHAVAHNEDLTCETRQGHVHPETLQLEKEYGHRYIVHDEPEEGYVVLNGVKRKLTDCDKY